MAATSWNILNPRLCPEDGSIPEIISFPETAGSVFKAGTPVRLTTGAGTVAIVADSAVGFLGIAMEDASGVTNAALRVQVCRDDTPIVARCTNAGVATAPSTLLTQGVAYDFYLDGTDGWVGVDDTTTFPAIVYESPIYDSNGTETTWGNFRVLADTLGNIDEA